MATVGELVGYLRLDTSGWDRKAAEARNKVDELARKSPTVKVQADTAVALAKLEAVRAAVLRVQAAEARLTELRGNEGAKTSQLRSAEAALISARVAATKAAVVAGNAEDALNNRSREASRLTVTWRSQLYSLALTLGTTLGPVLAATSALLIGLGAAGAVALVGFLGIKEAMKAGTLLGQQYTEAFSGVKTEFAQIKQIAAAGLFSGINSGLASLGPAFGFVNEQVSKFSHYIGAAISHLIPGLVALLVQLGPLFDMVGKGIVSAAASFQNWAQNSDGFSKFIKFGMDNIPHLLATLGALTQALLHIVEALSPFGSIVLTGLTVFAKAIDAIPIGVLQIALPLMIGLNQAIKAMAVAQAVSLALTKFAASLGLVATAEVGAAAGATALIARLGPLGLALAAVTVTAQSFAGGDGPLDRYVKRKYGDRFVKDAQGALHLKYAITAADHAAAEATVEFHGLDRSMHQAATAAATHAAAQARQRAAMAASKAQADALSHAFDALRNKTLGLAGAQTNFSAALLQVRDSAKQNGRSISENTQKGIANRQAIEGAANALLDKVDADKAAGRSAQKTAADFEYGRSRLLRVIATTYGARSAAYAYAQQLLRIPGQRSTTVILRAAAARAELAAYQSSLNQLRDKTITITQYVNQAIRPFVTGPGATHSQNATGGLISGPGTGISDSITTRVSAGEFIMPADMTARFLPLLESIRSGTAALSSNTGMRAGGWMTPSPEVYNVTVNVSGTVISEHNLVNSVVKGIDAQRRRKGGVGLLEVGVGDQRLTPLPATTP